MTSTERQSVQWLRILVPLVGSRGLEAFLFFLRLLRRTLQSRTREGVYEVLDYRARLELLDTMGERAILHKQQQVRFLQDNIIAYQDRAWGDGDFIADYWCSPGVAVDTYREGHRYNILISLRKTKHAGDTETFRIERTILNGFTKPAEDFQIDIDHRTRQLVFSIVFPAQRHPKQVTLVEQNSTRSEALGPDHQTELADGRLEFMWQTENPRLFEAYILHWEW